MKLLILSLFLLFAPLSFAQNRYTVHTDSAFLFLSQKDTLHAIESFKNALRSEPGNPQNALLLNNIGTLYRSMGNLEEALANYSNGLFFAPKSSVLLVNRARLYCDIDSFRLAMTDYRLAMTVQPENEDILYSVGVLAVAQRDTFLAQHSFSLLLKKNPKSTRARAGLAAYNKSIGAYTDAERLYSQLIASDPKNDRYYLERSELYFEWNKLNDAVADIDKSIALNSTNYLALILKGEIRIRQFDKSDARRLFEKARSAGAPSRMIDPLIAKCR